MTDKKQRNKVDREICRTLQNKENYIRKYNKVGVTNIDKNSPSGQYEQDSVVLKVL